MMKRVVHILKHVVLGSMVVSKASASVVAPASSEDVFDNLRRHLNAQDAGQTAPTDMLPDLDSTTDIAATIRESYLGARRDEWSALDDYWSSHQAILSDPAAFQQFLAARSTLQLRLEGDQDTIMKNWLQRAHHRPGHYDSGGGNGCTNGC